MNKLEAITEKLIGNLSDISQKQSDGYVIYKLDQGEAMSFTLKEDEYVLVIDTFLSANTLFPLHNHEGSAETLILERGSVTLICDEPGHEKIRKEMVVGVPYYIPTDMNHLLHAKENSWVLGTLIPPDEGMLK